MFFAKSHLNQYFCNTQWLRHRLDVSYKIRSVENWKTVLSVS